ncbi:hypothetical protein [Lewinella sp. LCG006]|uniref:hypothetical protein n=1 Tax=Lewinella sp. LCG006 TaxID=3231911 RepID=UPI00346065D4
MKRFPLFFTIISALAAFIGIFREDFGSAIQQAVEPVEVQTFADLATQAESQGKVFICDYSVQAVEVRYDTLKIGNFPALPTTDRYHQDKPYIVKFPGKKGPPIATLLQIVPPQEKGAKVVAISSVARIDKTCKIYDFFPPVEEE